jgi:hypothetical protein
MEALLGTTPPVFIGLTVVLFGGAALSTGDALAATWRPFWHAVPYALLLAAGARFLTFALFEGDLVSPSGFAITAVLLLVLEYAGYRRKQARRMVRQYPWLYERAGIFSWRDKA